MAIIQRFGGTLNLNVHVHAVVLDGHERRRGDQWWNGLRSYRGQNALSGGIIAYELAKKR